MRALGHSLIQATQLLSLNVNGEHRLLQLPCCGSCPAMLRFDKCGSWSVDRLFHRDTRSAGADRAAARHPKPAGTVHHRSAVLCLDAVRDVSCVAHTPCRAAVVVGSESLG